LCGEGEWDGCVGEEEVSDVSQSGSWCSMSWFAQKNLLIADATTHEWVLM
jgi:hypothetical protein